VFVECLQVFLAVPSLLDQGAVHNTAHLFWSLGQDTFYSMKVNNPTGLVAGLALGVVGTVAAQALLKLRTKKPLRVLITGAAGRLPETLQAQKQATRDKPPSCIPSAIQGLTLAFVYTHA
jgi:hypothetical protein